MRRPVDPQSPFARAGSAVSCRVFRFTFPLAVCLCLLLALGPLLPPGLAAAEFEDGFRHPPDSAKPGVYWFWINGNITSNGITADLEAVRRVGLGSVLIMEASRGEPEGPVAFMGGAWRGLFQHTLAEARRLGLKVILNNSAGWEGSGGPWITPEQSMQELVWSETNVMGPRRFEGTIPPAVTGYYHDVALLAFPTGDEHRIPGIETKAAYSKSAVNRRRSAPPAPTSAFEKAIAQGDITTLRGRLEPGGRVVWDVPPGRWTIMRFGHASNGVGMKPVPTSGQGLNCDKLSSAGIEANFAGMMAKLIADTGLPPGELTHSALAAVHIDSWENGAQNWTAKMPEEFARRRGYDLTSILPVITGRVVGSPEISERFLRDLCQTISELLVQNYAGRMRALSRAHGLSFTCEAYNGPCDDITYAGQADIPIGEFWAPNANLIDTCKAMASAAHLYGKSIVGAEAFTAHPRERGTEHPGSLKILADQAFCAGINQLFLHRFVHQPWAEERNPGMGMGPFGIQYDRTQTWWEWTAPWHQYLARCQYLLRQGLFVADICYLQPEAPPQRPGNHPHVGYDWDECTADAVLSRMSVKDGGLLLPDGMSYRVLVLPEPRTATPELLRKLKDLVAAGATVIGPRPISSPSLSAYPQCDEEVQRLGAELWGDCDGQSRMEHRFGDGRVVWGQTPERWLERSGVPPDFTSDASLRYVHRRAGETNIYFLANPQAHAVTAQASFRLRGRLPELWWPETGQIERAALRREEGQSTHLLIQLEPGESVFVVFRAGSGGEDPLEQVKHDSHPLLSISSHKPGPAEPQVGVRCDIRGKAWLTASQPGVYEFIKASGKTHVSRVPAITPARELDGPWRVRFQPNRGAPGEAVFDRLISWSEHPDAGIKYFSGAAVYLRELEVPAEMLQPGRRVYLDLGRVSVMARVKCNGDDAGILWKAPFRTDLTSLARPGMNHLEIQVVNRWPNRQIGDEQLPDDSERRPAGASEYVPAGLIQDWPQWLRQGKPSPTGRFTFTSWRLWRKDDSPLESGLLGPVRLSCGVIQAVTPSTTIVPAPPPDAPNGPKQKRAETVLQRAKDHPGSCDIIFIGDSITEQWETAGSNVWRRYYGHRKCLNLGVGGDRTQRVLWRFEQGQLDGLKPKVAVLMIGTNNSNNEDNTEGEILEGVQAIVAQLRQRLPEAKILVLGIFPRGATFNSQRGKVLQVNQALARTADGRMIHYLDLGSRFLEPDGSISPEVMPGFLHLSERGYRIWAETMEPKLKELLGE
jgi:lysophospholipase L1-like esterase